MKRTVNHIHCQTIVVDHTEVTKFAKKYCKRGWVYAFVKYPNGKIILCEVSYHNKVGGYCPASEDIVNKEVFDEVAKSDSTFYGGKTWEQYRSAVLKNLLGPIKMKCRW